MADYTLYKQSDLQWTRASKTLATPADGTHVVCPIPKNTLVKAVIVNKTVAYSKTSATATIGFKGNGETAETSSIMSIDTFNPTTVGVVNSLQGGTKYAAGKYFTRAGSITVTTDDNGGTAGTFQVFVEYTQLKN
jgi:hypothetical protein